MDGCTTPATRFSLIHWQLTFGGRSVRSFGKFLVDAHFQCMIAGVILLFSVLTATLGYVSLSISMAMIFAVVCVMGCMTRDVMELCEDLMEEED